MQRNDDDKQYVVMKNEFALARHKFNVLEAKAIRMALARVDDRKDVDFYEFEFSFDDIEKMIGKDDDNLSRSFKNIGKKLSEQTIDIRIGDGDADWLYIPMFKKIMYKGGVLTIWFNDELKPYLLDIRTNFLKYDHELTSVFTSVYSIRVYEALKAMYGEKQGKENVFEISLKRFREITDTETKYKSFYNFRERVLDIATKEITEHSDFEISYELKKMGKYYSSVIFYMYEKKIPVVDDVVAVEQIDVPLESGVSDTDFIITLTDLLSVTETCTFSQAEKMYFYYEKDRDKLLENIKKAKAKQGIRNFIGYIWDAKDRQIKDNPPKPKIEKKNNKNDYGYPISKEREQAYLDMEVDYVEDFWPDLEVQE